MIDTDKYEGHSEMIDANEIGEIWEYLADTISEDRLERAEANYNLVADAPLLLEEVKRSQSEPTVTVDDYHKKGHLYVTVRFPDGDEYVGLVEKWEGEEE